MVSKSASLIGPFVPNPTMTSSASRPCAFMSRRIDSPSAH